jgi:hypothetical protein
VTLPASGRARDQLDAANHEAVLRLLGGRAQTELDAFHLYLDNFAVLKAT